MGIGWEAKVSVLLQPQMDSMAVSSRGGCGSLPTSLLFHCAPECNKPTFVVHQSKTPARGPGQVARRKIYLESLIFRKDSMMNKDDQMYTLEA